MQEDLEKDRVEELLDGAALTDDDLDELGLRDFSALKNNLEFKKVIDKCLEYGELKQNSGVNVGLEYLSNIPNKSKFDADDRKKFLIWYKAYKSIKFDNNDIKDAIFNNKNILKLDVNYLKDFFNAVIEINKYIGKKFKASSNGVTGTYRVNFHLLFKNMKESAIAPDTLDDAIPVSQQGLQNISNILKKEFTGSSDQDKLTNITATDIKEFIQNDKDAIKKVADALKTSPDNAKKAAGNILVVNNKKNISFYNTLTETLLASNNNLNSNLCKLLFLLVEKGLYKSNSHQDTKFRFIIMQTSNMLKNLRNKYLENPKDPKVKWIAHPALWDTAISFDDFKQILMRFCIVSNLGDNLSSYINVDEAEQNGDTISVDDFFDGNKLKPLGSKNDNTPTTIIGQFNYWMENYKGTGKNLGDKKADHTNSNSSTRDDEYSNKEYTSTNSQDMIRKLNSGVRLSDADSNILIKTLNNPKNKETTEQIKDLLLKLLQNQ